jgi:hypothetical protein
LIIDVRGLHHPPDNQHFENHPNEEEEENGLGNEAD